MKIVSSALLPIMRSSSLVFLILLLLMMMMIGSSSPMRCFYVDSFPINNHYNNIQTRTSTRTTGIKERFVATHYRTCSRSCSNSIFFRTIEVPRIRKSNTRHWLSSSSSSSSSQQSSSTTSTAGSSTALQPPALSIEKLTCSHNGGVNYQLNDASYVLQRGTKVALVGRNGAGKSTFLKIIAEASGCADSSSTNNNNMKYNGQVICPRDIRVAFVEQEPPMLQDVTVGDALLGMTDSSNSNKKNNNSNNNNNIKRVSSVYDAVRRYRMAMQNAQDNPEEFTKASSDMDTMNGWDVLTKCDEIATKLRVYQLQNSYLSQLSGGERKRVALAASLIQEPDVLLLDEPTNYLSLAGVQWLGNLLKSTKLTVLMVTHDRAFLDDVCDRVLELDEGKLYEYTYSGGLTGLTLFDDYIQSKQDRLALEEAVVQSAKAKYRVELDWMRRQPQARETKSKSRIDAFYKLEKATKPKSRPNALLQIQKEGFDDRRIGGKILSIRNAHLQFDTNNDDGDATKKIILNDFSYDFCKGDRICLAGSNGVGKTSFIRVLAGEIPPDSGFVEKGDTIVLGVYDQLGIKLDDTNKDQTALDFVREVIQEVAPSGTNMNVGSAAVNGGMDEARKLLRQFEFPKERWNERLSILSGGERRRLQMLSVISKRPNFLIMDEPSVDLDITTLQALETYLREDFNGVLLIVSHDRYFADKVTDHLFVFEGNGEIKDFQGSLSEYASALIELENMQVGNGNTDNADKASNNKSIEKIDYKEEKAKRNEQRNALRQAKKDMDSIEKLIDKLKDQSSKLQKEIDTSADKGWSVLADLTDKLNSVNNQIEENEIKWLASAEIVEEAEVV